MGRQDELVLFMSNDQKITIPVPIRQDTVWLTRTQMASLFGRDVKTIGKHIGSALREELAGMATVAKFATVQKEGGRIVERAIEHYSLDMILSVGYRVKSQRGIEFRVWSNKVLTEYIIKGNAVNHARLTQLGKIVKVLRRAQPILDADQVLGVVEGYTKALDMLDDYDNRHIQKPQGKNETYVLSYDECIRLIDSMRFNAESGLFGREKDDSFRGSINAIYQTFDGSDVYPTVQEKAANLLYLITKNHSFLDGNKRIAAAVFLFFLAKNGLLYSQGEKRIKEHTLVAVTILIAESNPAEKEEMIWLVMNFLSD